MTEEKAKPHTPTPNSEEAIRIRIQTLEEIVKTTEGAIKSMEGKLLMNNPKEIADIQAENNVVQNKIDKLENLFYGLLIEGFQNPKAEELKSFSEILRESAIEYFKKADIRNEIWKNIES